MAFSGTMPCVCTCMGSLVARLARRECIRSLGFHTALQITGINPVAEFLITHSMLKHCWSSAQLPDILRVSYKKLDSRVENRVLYLNHSPSEEKIDIGRFVLNDNYYLTLANY